MRAVGVDFTFFALPPRMSLHPSPRCTSWHIYNHAAQQTLRELAAPCHAFAKFSRLPHYARFGIVIHSFMHIAAGQASSSAASTAWSQPQCSEHATMTCISTPR